MTTPTPSSQESSRHPEVDGTSAPSDQTPSKAFADHIHSADGMFSASVTTAFVSIILSWVVMVIYFSYFPPVPKSEPQPRIMAVDMLMVGSTIAQMTGFDESKTGPLFAAVEEKLMALREEGVIVLDTHAAVALPPQWVIAPQDLIPNVPEDVIRRNQAVMKTMHETVNGLGSNVSEK